MWDVTGAWMCEENRCTMECPNVNVEGFYVNINRYDVILKTRFRFVGLRGGRQCCWTDLLCHRSSIGHNGAISCVRTRKKRVQHMIRKRSRIFSTYVFYNIYIYISYIYLFSQKREVTSIESHHFVKVFFLILGHWGSSSFSLAVIESCVTYFSIYKLETSRLLVITSSGAKPIKISSFHMFPPSMMTNLSKQILKFHQYPIWLVVYLPLWKIMEFVSWEG